MPNMDRRAKWRGCLTRWGVKGFWLRDTASLHLSHREKDGVEKPWPHCCPLSRAYLLPPIGPTQTEDLECVSAESAVHLLGSEPRRAERIWEEPSVCGEKSACAKVRQTVKLGSFHIESQFPLKGSCCDPNPLFNPSRKILWLHKRFHISAHILCHWPPQQVHFVLHVVDSSLLNFFLLYSLLVFH